MFFDNNLAAKPTRLNHIIACLLFVALIFLVILIYWPALNGPFLLDDFNNLINLDVYANISSSPSLIIENIFDSIKENGSPGRILSFLSFNIDDVAWPSNPWRFKYTNLMFHLLNGILIFTLSRIILNSRTENENEYIYFPLLAATLWLLHPLLVSTTMYVVQRMVILSSLFTLIGIIFYIKARINLRWSEPFYHLSLSAVITIFLTTALLFKEIGINYLLYLIIIEITLFSSMPNVRKISPIWKSIFLFSPMIIVLIYGLISLQTLDLMYMRRDYTMVERLLTEPIVLIHYISQIIYPSVETMGLFHDDFVISSSIFSSVSAFISLLLVVVLSGLALYIRKSHSFISFCILWFFLGHLLEASVLPLELYFEHRNYLPMLGILLLVVFAFLHIARRYKYSLLVIPFVISILIFQTNYLVKIWSDEGRLYQQWATFHPNSARAYLALAQYEMYINRDIKTSIRLLEEILEFDKWHTVANLRYLQFTCNRSSSQVHLAGLIANSKHLHFRTGVLSALAAVVDNVENRLCADNFTDQMRAFVEELTKNPRFIIIESDKNYLLEQLARLRTI